MTQPSTERPPASLPVGEAGIQPVLSRCETVAHADTASVDQVRREPSHVIGKGNVAARVLVMGLGRFGGGVGVTRWLVEQGAAVTVTDMATKESLTESVAAIADLPVTLHLGRHDVADLDETDLVIVNPAVPKNKSAYFQEITRRGLAWSTEMNLFCERCRATVVGVTGTYGKSTTCAMLAEALQGCVAAKAARFTGVHLGGNIGRSLLADLATIRETDVVVLEMSNAQLEDLPQISWRPEVAVITNVWPHHLDRHGTLAAYALAKFNIVATPPQAGSIVHGDMHPEAMALLDAVIRERGSDRSRCAIGVTPSATPVKLRVPGEHNARNADCVLTVCRALGLDERIVRQALENYASLPHRLEHIRTLDGVDYINDSKSTSPSATVVALQSLDRPIVAIVGGQRKDVPLSDFAGALVEHCRVVICSGESGPTFAAAIRSALDNHPQRATRVELAETIDSAVLLSRNVARPGDVVLYSPGAPSFDAFANFTQRGDHFRHVVAALGNQSRQATLR